MEDGDTVATDEIVWNFSGNLGDKNFYRYKLDSKNWTEWQRSKSNGTEARLTLTRADTGSHVVTFETCYNPDDDITDTSFTFVKINVPFIIFQPENKTVTDGKSVSFSVGANGTNLFYQWQKDTVNIEGATSSILSLPAVTIADNNTRYRCIIYNVGGLTVTIYANLSVNKKIIPPLIATQPESQNVTEGQAVTFKVSATGTDITYQWKKGSVNINGAITSSYTIPVVTLADSGAKFHCVISNISDTITSDTVILSIEKKFYPPIITLQPVSQTIMEGKPVTFVIDATGTNLHYQWLNGAVPIPNATSATFTIASVLATDNNAVYSCVVSNSVDTLNSNGAVLSVVQDIVAPAITIQPTSKTVTAGKSAVFSVIASGTALYYQWYKDTSAIQRAVFSEYTIPVATIADSGKSFKCMVFNSVDTVISSVAKLTVTKNVIAPAIAEQPQSKSVTEGQPVTFKVFAAGSDLAYQWLKNNIAITGAITNTYTVAATSAGDNGLVFQCIIYNTADTIVSNPATLSVIQNNFPPVIRVQPLDQTVTEGQTAIFSVIAEGTALVYQWQKGATAIIGATNATYSLTDIVISDSGSEYSCIVSNAIDTVVSKKVKLVVTQNIVAPSITGQPVSVTVIAGGTTTFTVTTNGTNLKYQWQKGNADIAGANTSTYSVISVAPTDNAANYRCIVSNTADAVISNTVSLTVVYTVTYLGNGNATGSVPVDTSVYPQNGIISIKGNTGSLARTGYTFSGWTSSQDGSGKAYQENDTLITGLANTQLFAKWCIDSFTVSFNSNEGSSVLSQKIAYGGYATEPAVPTRIGFAFAGWHSNQALTALFDFTTPVTSPRTLFAKWNPVYRVIYDVNGGNGIGPVDNNLYQSGQFVSVLDKPTGLTQQYYDFVGWNTTSNGTGANRLAGTTYQIGSKNDTLYAKWQIAKPVITLHPVAISVFPLDNISISVTAEGIGLAYQWQKDGVNLSGETKSIYSKQMANFTDSGYYCCIVSNVSGNTISSTTKLTIRTTLKDADSNEYKIVVIGNQVWTAENLRTTKYNDGTSIFYDTSAVNWGSSTIGKYCWFNNSSTTKEQVGAFYNWYAVDSRKLAPAGWHVPETTDWSTLENYLIANGYNYDGSTTDNKIAKSLSAKILWPISTYEGTPGNGLELNNKTGFSALPNGYRDNNGKFQSPSDGCNVWSATSNNVSDAYFYQIFPYEINLFYFIYNKSFGRPVRLVKD
jgi:uncharacterized protein (TIGR02145 family)/uncharacterized repeat protein (TIGR02543 family)